MSHLLSLQRKFLEDFQGNGSFENYIKINGASPKDRLSVYQNNITQALRRTLALTYPLTWKLIGEDCANGAAYAFLKEGKSLPTEGNLDDWGATFPDFLEQYPPTQSLPYLPDFARIERLKHLAYYAEEALPLSGSNFTEMDPKNYTNLLLKLHPSTTLFSSPYPLDQVMAVVEGKVESIKLENRKTNVLIVRPRQSVNLHWISDTYFSFFSCIHQGDSLFEALQRISENDFQFYEILSFSLQNGLFSEYSFIS